MLLANKIAPRISIFTFWGRTHLYHERTEETRHPAESRQFSQAAKQDTAQACSGHWGHPGGVPTNIAILPEQQNQCEPVSCRACSRRRYQAEIGPQGKSRHQSRI